MNFQFGERPLEIVTGPGRIAQEAFRIFAIEQNKIAEINSPIPGKLIITLKEKRPNEHGLHDEESPEEVITDLSVYDIFLKQFLLTDDRFTQYNDDYHTKWTAHVIEQNGQPFIEAFYL